LIDYTFKEDSTKIEGCFHEWIYKKFAGCITDTEDKPLYFMQRYCYKYHKVEFVD